MRTRTNHGPSGYALGAVVGWCVLALGATAGAQDKATLKLNLKEGQAYTLVMTIDQKITQTVGGNPQNINQTMGFTFSMKPSKVDPDGTIHGAMSYDAVKVKMNGPMGNVDYDSAKEGGGAVPANPMAKAFSALVGQSLEVSMTPTGQVKDVKGSDKIVAAILKTMEIPEGPARAQVEQQMKLQFGEEALKKNFEQMTGFFPKTPVAIGDTWEVEQKLTNMMPMTVKTKYTLKSLQGGKATLDFAGTLSTDANAPAAGVAPGAKFDLKGEQTGSLVVDTGTGWVSSGTGKQSIDGKMVLDQGGQKFEVPMNIQSNMTFEQPKK